MNPPKRKTQSELATTLFNRMAEVMADVLKGEKIIDKEGEVHTIPPTAPMLSVIRQFLKDNRIEADPDTSPELGEVKSRFQAPPFDPDAADDLRAGTKH